MVSSSVSDEKKPLSLVGVKVPQRITMFFWLTKSCATTVGETLSDFFNTGLGFGLGGAAALFFPLLLLNLVVQFYYPKYIPAVYWLAVVFMSICGTIMTDGLHDNLGVELWIEVIVFFFLMCACFAVWYRNEGTLDIHSINSWKREAYYWLTILFTFSLGTAIGDGISEGANMGYGPTFGFFCGCLIFIATLWYFKLLGEITSFWFAYIMTRPLGAAAGDLIASPKDHQSGGLGAGTTSGIFTAIICICVIILHITGYDLASPELTAVPTDEINAVNTAVDDLENAKKDNVEMVAVTDSA